jgi:transposase
LKKFGEASPRQADKDDLATENARLKADLKRMTEERDILKKAAKYFANDPGYSTRSFAITGTNFQ